MNLVCLQYTYKIHVSLTELNEFISEYILGFLNDRNLQLYLSPVLIEKINSQYFNVPLDESNSIEIRKIVVNEISINLDKFKVDMVILIPGTIHLQRQTGSL